MSKPTAIGQLTYEVMVTCPLCQVTFDAIQQEDEQDDMTIPIFNNEWDKVNLDVICPHCNQPITVNGVEY